MEGGARAEGTRRLDKAGVAVRGPLKEEEGAEMGPVCPEDTQGQSVVSGLGTESRGPGEP